MYAIKYAIKDDFSTNYTVALCDGTERQTDLCN